MLGPALTFVGFWKRLEGISNSFRIMLFRSEPCLLVVDVVESLHLICKMSAALLIFKILLHSHG